MIMKIVHLLLIVVFVVFSSQLQAQSCCDKLRQQGIEAYTKGDYNTAIKKWEAAKGCASKCTTDDLDVKISDAKAKLNPPKKQEIKPKPKPPQRVESKVVKPEVKAIEPEMVFVQGGTFTMGCMDGRDSDCGDEEKPAHSVTLSDYYIGKYEVTIEEYDAFCKATKREKPSDEGWGRGKRPVIDVIWEDASAYCQWLSKKTGKNYRLPTEAEWEYAARGGANSKRYKYSGSDDINKVAVTQTNQTNNKTEPVGSKAPNELGLYDMTGNVCEYCSEWYGEKYYAESDNSNNPTGPTKGMYRVVRGGSWVFSDDGCRVSSRYFDVDGGVYYLGFRLAKD